MATEAISNATKGLSPLSRTPSMLASLVLARRHFLPCTSLPYTTYIYIPPLHYMYIYIDTPSLELSPSQSHPRIPSLASPPWHSPPISHYHALDGCRDSTPMLALARFSLYVYKYCIYIYICMYIYIVCIYMYMNIYI